MTEGIDRGFRLRVCAGPDQGKELLVYGPVARPVAIGRNVDETYDLLCNDTKVSRHHATIQAVESGYSVTDHGSTNRTRLNDRVLLPEVAEPIADGDRLQCGAYTLIRFEILKPVNPDTDV